MPAPHETFVYDVVDFKVYPMSADAGASPTYGAVVDVPGVSQITMTPGLLTAELRGDGKLLARKGKLDHVEVNAQYAFLDLDVLNAIWQGTLNDGASEADFIMKGTNSLPYFGAAFQITDVEVGVGSVRCYIYKAQVTNAGLFGQQTNQFGQPTFDFSGIPAASNDYIARVFVDSAITALGLMPA